jgi:DNA-nicking Smr family endonuclease
MAPRKPPDSPRSPGARADEDERRYFERELAGVRPWHRGSNRISAVDFEPGPASPPRTKPVAKAAAAPTLRVESGPDGTVGTAFGVSKETVADLRHGRLGFDARCDLHKLHAEAARRKLQAFVETCVRQNLRAGLVICGRGLHSGPDGPVLAGVVTQALASSPTNRLVLAFVHAAAEHGGGGAIAVLFRRTEVTNR